jgi:hypothetical protein
MLYEYFLSKDVTADQPFACGPQSVDCIENNRICFVINSRNIGTAFVENAQWKLYLFHTHKKKLPI